jgi:L-threonylcarbamoyladenylate synthase
MTMLSEDIKKAIELLNQDELVAIPTETVYGLAGNIFSKKAVQKIFEMKQRPLFNPLIAHVHSIEQLDELAKDIPEKARLLSSHFWPGALTLLLKKQSHVPDLITAGKDTVAIRMPNHPIALQLLAELNYPLAAPSANPFGCISPTSAKHVEDYFGSKLKMVLDGGTCSKGIESTIIGFENNEAILYRLGSISIESIEEVIGKIKINNKNETTPEAPGMLSRHYAPLTTTFLVNNVNEFIDKNSGKKIGVLVFKEEISNPLVKHQIVLSKLGNLDEAASKLYEAMHIMDKLDLDIIVAERFPDFGLGKSINDRLERATKSL